jgi:iron complex transport system ATP-binding protein
MSTAELVTCRDLSLRVGHPSSPRVLVDGLQWVVHAGERWAVLGPNGSGKSTLLAALAGVRRAEAGVVLYDGAPLSAIDVAAQATRRALVTDRWHDPFSANVSQTVRTARYRFGNGDASAAAVVQEALARLDCAHLADADVRMLSRGERQRVAIATALAQETPLILLDEPIAHQDPKHQALVVDVLREARDRTVVASLHDVNAALRFATHALLLTGRGAWSAGAASDLLTAPRLSELFATPFASWRSPDPGSMRQVLVQQSTDARDSPPL